MAGSLGHPEGPSHWTLIMSLHWIIRSHLHSVYTVKSSLHFKWEFDKTGNLSTDEVNGCYPCGLGEKEPMPFRGLASAQINDPGCCSARLSCTQSPCTQKLLYT